MYEIIASDNFGTQFRAHDKSAISWRGTFDAILLATSATAERQGERWKENLL